jgi:acetyl esterase/lipase
VTTTQRAYDPDFLQIVDQLPAALDYSDAQTIAAMRSERFSIMGEPPPDRADVRKQDRSVPGRTGDPPVPVRIYTPKRAAGAVRGCVLEIHGGGFLFGDIAMMDPWCQAVAGELDAVVVSVEYRLAPEHRYPAAPEDCYAAFCWVASHAAELGIDPARIVLAGQSAGGALAAAVALMARDRGGPRACFQLLEIPVLDDRLDTPSMRAFTDTPLWNRPNAEASWKHYLGPAHRGEVAPYAAPARAADLRGLPPAYVSVMEFDPLRDEGILYAVALLQAGVGVELHAFPGTFHGSSAIMTAAVSQRATAESFTVLARALRPRESGAG